jgi:hypothetical protein
MVRSPSLVLIPAALVTLAAGTARATVIRDFVARIERLLGPRVAP